MTRFPGILPGEEKTPLQNDPESIKGNDAFLFKWVDLLIKYELFFLDFCVGRRQPGDGNPRG